MQSISEKVIIPVKASPDKVWDVIGAVGGVDKWFSSLIDSCTIEGDKRYCVTKDGIPLNENVISVDHSLREFTFGIPEQAILPVSNIIEVMKVIEGNNGHSQVEWSATFDATEENAPVAQEAFKNLWTQGISELEEYVINQ